MSPARGVAELRPPDELELWVRRYITCLGRGALEHPSHQATPGQPPPASSGDIGTACADSVVGGNPMNRDELDGKVREIKGKAKQAAGDLTDDERLHQEGLNDEASGEAQEAFGK